MTTRPSAMGSRYSLSSAMQASRYSRSERRFTKAMAFVSHTGCAAISSFADGFIAARFLIHSRAGSS